MNEKEAKMAAMGLTTIGILFFIAMAFQVLPYKYAIFGGVACFIIAGLVRRLGKEAE
jgi:hypothetical protein